MRITLEQELLGVRSILTPNDAFVSKTMVVVRDQATQEIFSTILSSNAARKKIGLYAKFKQLPAIFAILTILLSLLFVGGAVYAAVRYIPDLMKISGSSETSRGTKEYTAADFPKCTVDIAEKTQKFEVAKGAQLTKTDVQKLIQARCETDLMDSFASHTWPTYGTHKVWKDGDTIYYAQVGTLGTVQSVSATEATITINDTSSIYKAPSGQHITAYASGIKIPLNNLKKGDTVRLVNRVADIYNPPSKAVYQQGAISYYAPTQTAPPHILGVIGIVKMTEPLKYYGSLQDDITEMPPCMGNTGEYCPQVGSIQVFPRVGGEGAQNPQLVKPTSHIDREISGTVASLEDSSLTLKSSSGKIYTMTTPTNALSDYNSQYAQGYGTGGTLQVGSSVSILYVQPKTDKAQAITPSQIEMINLLTYGDIKQGAIQPY